MESIPKTYREMLLLFLKGSGGRSMLALLVLIVAVKSYIGWFWWDAALFFSIFLLRGVFEWIAHSLFYHANPLPLVGWRLKTGLWLQHREHHKDPYDLDRILITYKGATLPSAVAFLMALLISRSLAFSLSLALVFLVVGAINEVGHLLCHCRIEHKAKFMKRFISLHRQHHFRDPHRLYGVTSPLGDYCFGTFLNSARPDER